MGWREALRIGSVGYRELAFQAIYGLRQGNLLPPRESDRLAERSARRVLQSKAMVAALLGFMALGGGVALTPMAQHLLGPSAPADVYRTAVVGGLFLLQLSLLWTTGLQILPVYLAGRIVPTLQALPVHPRDLDRGTVLLFLRLFDLPVLAILLLTPLAIGAGMRSPWAGIAAVPGSLATVLMALALALATGRFFIRRVAGSPSGLSATLLRWGLLILWGVPAFAIYVFISFSPELLRELGTLATGAPATLGAVLAVFPFPFAFLPIAAVGGTGNLGLSGGVELALLAAAAAYTLPLGALAVWMASAPRRLGLELPRHSGGGGPLTRPLRSRGSAAGLLLKDLRTASRSPGYAFVVLLPLLDATVIGLSTFVGTPTAADVFNLGAAAVSTAALLAIFFGPAFFATEVMGYSYTRALPLGHRALLGGKLALVLLIYALSVGIVLGFTLARVFSPWVFLAFVAAESPALAAGGLLELGLLFGISRRRGLAVTNLYTGAWWATAVVLPGLVVAGLPLLAFQLSPGAGRGLATMGALALAELAICLPLAIRWTRGGGP